MQIAIIGAGLAGISAGNVLTARGHRVVLFEKARGFGGRCATKRWEGHVVDHGAQYFTLRDGRFRAAAEAACGDALQRIGAPVLDENGNARPETGRWFHRDGNSRLARDLARGLDVQLETTIANARELLREAGGEFDHVISTAPFPQTAQLFGLTASFDYVPCLTVLLRYRGDSLGTTASAYAISDHRGPRAWSACENHKPGRIPAGETVLVAQMAETFSREHLEQAPENYAALVRPLLEARWQLPADRFVGALGHRWRYARVKQTLPPPELPRGLHFLGDALISSRVEDAWLAGQRAAALCAADDGEYLH